LWSTTKKKKKKKKNLKKKKKKKILNKKKKKKKKKEKISKQKKNSLSPKTIVDHDKFMCLFVDVRNFKLKSHVAHVVINAQSSSFMQQHKGDWTKHGRQFKNTL